MRARQLEELKAFNPLVDKRLNEIKNNFLMFWEKSRSHVIRKPGIVMYTDGMSCHKGTFARGAYVIYEDGIVIAKGIKEGQGWADIAEWLGMTEGINKLLDLKLQAKPIQVFTDLQWMCRMLQEKCRSANKRKTYYPLAYQTSLLLKEFKDISFTWIKRDLNIEADNLSKGLSHEKV